MDSDLRVFAIALVLLMPTLYILDVTGVLAWLEAH